MRSAIISGFTDPDKKKREKDERKEKKLRQKEQNQRFDAKLKESINAPFRGIPGANIPHPDRSDRVAGMAPPAKGEDVCSMTAVFRARIKTRHKTYIGLHRTLALTYDEKGDIFQFEPTAGGMVIFGHVQLEYAAEPVTRAFLRVDQAGMLRVTVNPAVVPPDVFLIRADKKHVLIVHAATNKLVCAEDHALLANRDPAKPGAWEKFSLAHPKEKEEIWARHVPTEFSGLHAFAARLCARRHNKKGIVGVETDLVCFSKNCSTWMFTPNASHSAFIISNVDTNQYLVVEGERVVLSTAPGEWRMDGDWNSTVSLCWLATGKLCYADKSDLRCNKEKKGEWETFEILR